MAEAADLQWRSNVETEIVLLKAGMTEVKNDVAAFRDEWRAKADEDRKAHRAARMTFPQIAGLIFGAVSATAILLGGLWFVIAMQVGAATTSVTAQVQSTRQSAEASIAQVALSTRGQADSVTALNGSIQNIQRDQASDRVRLGLVEQMAASNSRFIDQAQSFDAQMARNDERLKALEQAVRDIAARR
jgi:hypothetical protein